jgi:hypothetical protein
MLSRIARQPSQVCQQHAAVPLAPPKIAEALDHGGDKGAQRGFIVGNGKRDLGGAGQEFLDLLNCLELCFVHIDHHG